jgi:hypothetical protein
MEGKRATTAARAVFVSFTAADEDQTSASQLITNPVAVLFRWMNCVV